MRPDSGGPRRPTFVTGPPPDSPGTGPADLGRRLLAQVLDALWSVPLLALLVMAGVLLQGGADLSPGAGVLLNVAMGLIVLQFWATRQATPGKRALDLRVVAVEDGGPVPFPRLVARYVGYLVASVPLGLGFLWAAWDPRGQGWHDRLARTLVVRDLPPAPSRPGRG